MNRQFVFSLCGACALLWGCDAADNPELTTKDFSQFTPTAEGIRRASFLTLYEGLPPTWEHERRQSELANKKTKALHGFDFYERPLALATDEVELLRRLFAASDSYYTYQGPKLCGGFHPDYCLSWQDGEATYDLLICFGCGEMKLYGPKSELIVDVRPEVIRSFKAAIKGRHDQRPSHE